MRDGETTRLPPGEDRQASSQPARRRATLLYADITGSTRLSERVDPEELYEIVGSCLKRLEAVARRHGAALVKSRGDGVLAIFGIPTALEAPARAAVNAAIDMRNEVAELPANRRLDSPLELHSGVNTGLVVAGEVATGSAPEVDVVGDAVNVAARLSDLAPSGTIYVGEQTFRSTEEEFEYRPVRRVRLKGKQHSVTVYEVLSARSVLHRPTATSLLHVTTELVGRHEEFARLEAAVAALERGQGSFVQLVGEAGVGKSRLAAEMKALADGCGIAWVEGRAISIGSNLRYHVVGDLLRGIVSVPDQQADREAAGRFERFVREALGDDADDAWPFLAALAGYPLDADAQTRFDSVQGEALEQLTRMSARLLLTRFAAESPLVIVLEDLHWADPASVELFEALVGLARTAPIAFLALTRPESVEAGPAGALRARAREELGDAFVEIDVGPLAGNDCDRLVGQLFRDGGVSTRVRRRIADKSGGNPFFVEEVVHSLVAAGLAVAGPAGLEAADAIDEFPLPDTVEDVILQHLDQRSPEERAVVEVACVLGDRCERSIVSEILSKDTLDAIFASLVAARVLRSADGETYTFAHALIREVAYASLTRARRRELHGGVARALESLWTAHVPGRDGILAYHYTLGDDMEHAEELLFRAGEDAARIAASREALHFFREALRVYLEKHPEGGDLEKRALLEKRISYALFYRGELVPAERHLNRWLELIGERPRGRGARAALRIAANAFWAVWVAFAPRRQRSPATDRQREVIVAMFDRARSQVTSSPERFLVDSLESFRRISDVDPSTVPGAGGMIASAGTGIFSFTGLSFAVARRLLAIAEPLVDPSDPSDRFFAGSMRAYHACFEGDWSRRHEIDEDTIDTCLRLGQLWDVSTYAAVDGRKKLHQGRFEEALQSIARLQRVEERYGYSLAASGGVSATAMLHVERGELGAAWEACERYHRDHEEALLNILALALKTKVRALQGDLEAARSLLDEAQVLVRRVRVLPPFHSSALRRSRLLVDVLALEEATRTRRPGPLASVRRAARRSARRARRIARRVAWERVEIERLLGTWHWCCGRRRHAVASWEASLVAGEALSAWPEWIRTVREITAKLGADTPQQFSGRSVAELASDARRVADEIGLVDTR